MKSANLKGRNELRSQKLNTVAGPNNEVFYFRDFEENIWIFGPATVLYTVLVEETVYQ